MASGLDREGYKRNPNSLILKEGFLCKKGNIIKIWSRKYFVLTRESLNYFKRESETREPMGRVFLSDLVNITTKGLETKRSFVFSLNTKRRYTLLQGANVEDMESWVYAIEHARDTDKELERKDPFRKTLRRLEPGVKRVTLVKDPQKGIGCTIKNAAGHILVNRIIEDGPIAMSGVLRPGDEILDIQGTTVTGLQVQEISEIIKNAPQELLATVRPLTVLKRNLPPPDNGKIIYSSVFPTAAAAAGVESTTSHSVPTTKFITGDLYPELQVCGSLDDVGTYDDDEVDGVPPPIPRRTDDAFVLLDPSSSSKARKFKSSSDENLISHNHAIVANTRQCRTPPFPVGASSSPSPPPIPHRTDEALIIGESSQLHPPSIPSIYGGKNMTRCLSEGNALSEPTSGRLNPAELKAKDSRSLQRGQRQHDYVEIGHYADLAPLKCSSKQ